MEQHQDVAKTETNMEEETVSEKSEEVSLPL